MHETGLVLSFPLALPVTVLQLNSAVWWSCCFAVATWHVDHLCSGPKHDLRACRVVSKLKWTCRMASVLILIYHYIIKIVLATVALQDML